MTQPGVRAPRVQHPRLKPSTEAIVWDIADALHDGREAHEKYKDAVRKFGSERAEAFQGPRAKAAGQLLALWARLKADLLGQELPPMPPDIP